MKIAQIQMHVSGDKTADLRHAAELIRGAGEIDLAVLPEMFCCPYDNSCFHRYGEEAGGEAQQALSALARERGIWLIGGSIPELEGGNVYNTSFVYAPDGSCAARHRKTHLFDIDVAGGQRFMESETLTPGSDITTFETPWGDDGTLHLLRLPVRGTGAAHDAARGEGAVRARGLQHDDRARRTGNCCSASAPSTTRFYRRHLARARRERVLPRMGPLHRL